MFLGPIATFFIVAFERGNGAKSQPEISHDTSYD